jgi:uncharacterized protein YkwD
LIALTMLASCSLDEDSYDEEVSAVEGTFDNGAAEQHAARFNPHRKNHVDRPPLDRRDCLNEIARRRARKMADGQCPGGDTICHFDGLGNAITNNCPWSWSAAGENVGVGPSEFALWQAFLDSAPHHANIDSAHFNRFGVGAFRRASDDSLFIVHVFAEH